MSEKANYTSDLNILSKSRKVTFESDSSEEKITLILHPFKFKDFKKVIGLVKKYWDCYLQVGKSYSEGKDKIIEETINDETAYRKQLLIENYDENFNEVGLIVQNVFQSGHDSIAEDVATLIGFCLREDFDLESLNIGEITVLLVAAIEINMDFFGQNLNKLELLKEQKVKQAIPKTGELESAA